MSALSQRRLDSWKEIAAHLQRGVRTVIRWEQEEGLPVHRHPHQKRGSVYAYAEEIDAWLASRGEAEVAAAPERGRQRRNWVLLARLTLAGGVVALLSGWLWWSNTRGRPENPAPFLAVMPFASEGSSAELAPLCDGLAEAIHHRLARHANRRLRLLAHSSVRRLGEVAANPLEAARQLQVDTILTGTLARRGDRLEIRVELVNVRDGSQAWTAVYRPQARELQAMEQEIAGEIAARLIASLAPGERQRVASGGATNAAAYRDYLWGRFHLSKRSGEGIRKSIELFEAAIRADGDFAPAYASLAEAYALYSYYALVPAKETAPQARAAALTAIRLDPQLALAYAALGYVESDYWWDWTAAEQHFRKALEVDPQDAEIHLLYGGRLVLMRRFAEAAEEFQQGLRMDPLSMILNTNVAHVHYFSRDYQRGVEHCRRTIVLDPGFPNAHADLGRLLLVLGKPAEAVAELELAQRLDGGPMNALGRLGYAYAAAGRRDDALRLIRRLESQPQQAQAMAIALVYTGLGDSNQSLHWLERAVEDRMPYAPSIRIDPLFDAVRGDARFGELLRRMNLAP